jgi:hypothetical protein
LDQPTRRALVDHELTHCGQKVNGGWYVVGHDLEDFAAVVRRHGLWNENVKMYLRAAEKRDDTAQPRLDFGVDEGAEAKNDQVAKDMEDEKVSPWLA